MESRLNTVMGLFVDGDFFEGLYQQLRLLKTLCITLVIFDCNSQIRNFHLEYL